MLVQEALKELAETVKRIVNERIGKYGINEKTGTNTLEGSNLQKSLDVYPIEDGIALQIADYWQFISRGWARTGNYPGTFSQFVKNVNDWVRRKNIRWGNLTQNQITYIVIRNIWTRGLRPRPFMIWDDEGDLTKMIPELNAYIDKWFDDIFEEITKDIDKFFNQ